MKIFVNGTKYLSIILLLTGLTVRVVGAGDCDSDKITKIIEEQDKKEMELMEDAFWSLDGKPYPNMQNPTVAYVHFAHCRKVQNDKLYETSEQDYRDIKTNMKQAKNLWKEEKSNKDNKSAYKALKNKTKVAKNIMKIQEKHFEHCNKLLKEIQGNGVTKEVLNKYPTEGLEKTAICQEKFKLTDSARAGWYFRYSYFLYFWKEKSSKDTIETNSIERIASDNYLKYIMNDNDKEGQEKEYEKEMKADSVGIQNAYAYYCQTESDLQPSPNLSSNPNSSPSSNSDPSSNPNSELLK